MKSHTGERNYECSICNKKFLYSYNVVAHVRNVHDKKPGYNSCHYCSEVFERAGKLIEHLQEVHEIEHLKHETIEEESALYEFEKESQGSE
jgi:DNA-directed RNA polymerase subunit RPC12/RpoP